MSVFFHRSKPIMHMMLFPMKGIHVFSGIFFTNKSAEEFT